MKYWPILALYGPLKAKFIVQVSNGLTCISKNWCVLCNCYAFNASNVNIRAFWPIVASRRNPLLEQKHFFFTKFAFTKYRVISCNIVSTP